MAAQLMTLSPAKTERAMFMASDDNVLIRQILATHAPDGREVDVSPILQIVEDILNSATGTTPYVMVREALEDKAKAEVTTMLEALSYTINRLSCEISYKCMGGVDGHSTSVSLFNMLSSYSWDAKLVLTLAAFAINYGEFWLLAQIYSTNRLASRMAILKQLPIITDHFAELKPRFEALNNLIQSILDLSKCIVGFRDLPSNYISQDNQVYSTAVAAFPLAIYWIFRSVLACATNITYLSGMGHEYTISTTEVWELSSLTHKTKTMNEHLRKQLATCHQFIEEKKYIEGYEALVHTFEAGHVDNMKALRSLIDPKSADTQPPLVDGSTKKGVSLEVLRRKSVLLLISGLDISQEELAILEQIYNESRMRPNRPESLYEVVWIPVVDHSTPWTDTTQHQFENLQATMPWYSVYHPTLIDRALLRFIKENLNFKRKAILVVLDQQGKMVSPNALHMMWIWGSNAFPFTSSREEALWKEETWRLELLVDGIDAMILNWIREGKYVILYGSDDIEWTRKFTVAARAVAKDARVPLEMVYVGKSTKTEQIRRVSATIRLEKLSYQWEDPTMIWFFWTRLESMLFSKFQLRSDDENDFDPELHEIKKLLSYDKTGPWALLSRGSAVILNGYGTTVLSALQEYDMWKQDVEVRGFDSSFKDYYENVHQADHPCCRFEFETTVGRTPESMRCPECNRSMEKFVTFSCCHDVYNS